MRIDKYTYIILILFGLTVFFWLNDGEWMTPDKIFVVVMVVAILLGKVKSFFWDWSIFLFLLASYEYLRSKIPDVLLRTHTLGPIRAEEKLFGFLPTVKLQSLFFKGVPSWYDYFFVFIYVLHFVVPLAFALILWLRNRKRFFLFMGALSLLSFMGFATYYLYPATPPWLAAIWGNIPSVVSIQMEVYSHMGFLKIVSVPRELGFYSAFGANPVAAIPSLHVAYPFLILLFATYFYGRKGLLLFPYVSLVVLAVIYMGDHYFIDAVLGVIYSSVAFLVVVLLRSSVERLLVWGQIRLKKMLSK